MIRGIAYDDRRLRDIRGDPLVSTIIESAAAQCGFGLIYEFWGVFPERFSRNPEGFMLRKGNGAVWATAATGRAARECAEFLHFHEEGWVETDERIARLTARPREELLVMGYPEDRPVPAVGLPVREGTPTEVADCNLAAGAITPDQHEASTVNLHLAQRRRVGCSVTYWEDGRPVAAAAVTDIGSRYGQISYVATLPSREGNGFGRAMVWKCAGILRERGKIPLLACETRRKTFYEEAGFRPVGSFII